MSLLVLSAGGYADLISEEGARFPISMMGSGVWAEMLPLESAYKLVSVTGERMTLKSELERIGYLGKTPASYQSMPMAAHFELHIEQGPVLEAEQRKIGVVQEVQAYNWYTIELQGRGLSCTPGDGKVNADHDCRLAHGYDATRKQK